MPQVAEFEEKEYEIPFYVELANGSPYVWSPGQVLEKLLGFDGAQFTENLTFWKMIGRNHNLVPGINLDSIKNRLHIGRLLPTFRCNLLLQVKRPQYLFRRTRGYNLYSPYFRFEIEYEQQKVLEMLANKVRDRAFIGYASPTFYKLKDLYQHTVQSHLVSKSNFIKVNRLKGHNHWAYYQPGTHGQALSKPEFIEERPFSEELKQLAIQDNEWESKKDAMDHSELATSNLQELFSNIRAVCIETSLQDNYYSEEVLRRMRQMQYSEEDTHAAVLFFSNIRAFCSVLGVVWFVVG